MPITHRFDAESRVLFVEMTGAVSDEDILSYAAEVTADSGIDPVHDELIDTRGIEVPGASTPALKRAAELFSKSERTPEKVKVAMVASSDAAYGLARMYQAFRAESAVKIRVFREIAEARSWLGLPPE